MKRHFLRGISSQQHDTPTTHWQAGNDVSSSDGGNNFRFINSTWRAENINVAISQTVTRSLNSRPSKAVTYRTMPPSCTYFTGREKQLKYLREVFFTSKNAQTTSRPSCVIYGMGGIGKSQLSLRLIEENTDHFWEVFWVDATSRETIEASIIAIASHPVAQRAGVQPSVSSVLQWLTTLRKDWLLVFDGADLDPHDITPYLPGHNHGHILISTRNPDMCRIVNHSLEITDMEECEAVSLLLRSAGLNPNCIEKRILAACIAMELCFLPLALEQAGVAIASGLTPLHEYLTLYRNHRRSLSGDKYIRDPAGLALYTSWDISFQEILRRSEERDTPSGKRAAIAILILRIISFLHFEDIPEEFFQRAATSRHQTNERDRDGESGYMDCLLKEILSLHRDGTWNPLIFRSGIHVLRSFSFIKSSGTAAYTMHRLVHGWIRDRMTDRECQEVFGIVGSLFKKSIPDHSLGNHIPFCRVLAPHILAYPSFMSTSFLIWVANDHYLLSKLGDVLRRMGFSRQAKQWYSAAVEIQTIELGSEHPGTLGTLSRLLLTFRDLGDYKKAQQLAWRVVDAQRRVLGNDHRETLLSMSSLASIFRKLGEFQKSKELQEQVLNTQKRLHGNAHPETLMSMNSFASTLLKLGEAKKAKELFKEVLDTQERSLGSEHLDTLACMSNLASALIKLREYEKAKDLHERVLDARKRLLGNEHPDTLNSISNLASIFWKLKEFQKAKELDEQVLDAQTRLLGSRHPDTLQSMHDLAWSLIQLREFEKAKELFEKVLDAQMQLLGSKHPVTLKSVQNLAWIFDELKEFERAKELKEQVLNAQIQMLGNRHTETLKSMESLASTLERLGKLEGAQNFRMQVSRIISRRHAGVFTKLDDGNYAKYTSLKT